MAQNFKRTDRIAATIQRKLAEIIPKEIKDPRLGTMVSISAVKVTADLGHAKIYFTTLADPTLTTSILNGAAGYLRTALARTITFRTVPQLRFVYDESIEYASRLNHLINQVNPSEDDTDSEDNTEEN